jgi:hypothetical protein
MGTAILNLRMSPRRMLSAAEAADYIGLPMRRLKVDCSVAPMSMPGGRLLYDLKDLDTWLDNLKDGTSDGDDDIIGRL